MLPAEICRRMSTQNPALAEIKEFDKSIGQAYEKLVRTARVEWERRFPGGDPSDACVSVRIRSVGDKTGFDSEFPGSNSRQVIHPGAKLPARAKRRAH